METQGLRRAGLRLSPVVIILALSQWAQTCDTPVCQYALQNWQRDNYTFYYFRAKGDTPPDAKAHAALLKLCDPAQSQANLVFEEVDVAGLDALPEDAPARRVFKEWAGGPVPFYALVGPHGAKVFAGRPSADEAAAAATSPVRLKIAKLLCGGKAGVLLMLAGKDAKANATAEQHAKAVIAAVRKQGLDVAWLVLSRDDPREAWLVRQLLTVERDLPTFTEPMIFGLYGRARAREPYIGRGITERNILGLINFLNGPCTCEIKAQDSGMDMLTSWDWELKAADVPAAVSAPAVSALADFREPAAAVAPPVPAPVRQVENAPLLRNTVIVIGTVVLLVLLAGMVILLRPSH